MYVSGVVKLMNLATDSALTVFNLKIFSTPILFTELTTSGFAALKKLAVHSTPALLIISLIITPLSSNLWIAIAGVAIFMNFAEFFAPSSVII